MTTHQVWMIVAGLCVVALAGATYLWLRMPLFRWSCRRCKRVVCASRFHPGRCTCGGNALVAYFCGHCGSWNTSAAEKRRCHACSSSDLILGAEYSFGSRLVKARNRNL
jgi:hypothetical protein